MEPQIKPQREWDELKSFPSSQDEPEVALFGGYIADPKHPITTMWKIMNNYGPKSFVGNVGQPYDVELESQLKLHSRVRLREEDFGGIAYNGGITLAVNKPAYKILTNLSVGKVRVADIPTNFVRELTKYRLVETA